MNTPPASLPLRGLRVVDSSGPRVRLCSRLLADLGADVILIESTDPTVAEADDRAVLFDSLRGGVHFAYRNAGKRTLTLNTGSETGRARLLQLLSEADVWVESSHPSQHDGLESLAPDAVRRRFPSLVVVSVTDFGQSGPYRDFAGTDLIGYAVGGLLHRAGAIHRPPLVAPGSLADDTACVSAALGAVCTIVGRRGGWIDVSVQEAVANIADWSVPLYSTIGISMPRAGAGTYPLYKCRDGWLRMIVMVRSQWHTVLDWLGRPEALLDPKLDEYYGRLVAQSLIDEHLAAFFADWNKVDAAKEAQARGLAATPLLTPTEASTNEHTDERGSFRTMEIAAGVEARVPSGFWHLDRVRLGPSSPLAPVESESVWRHEREAPPTTATNTDHPFKGILVVDFGTGVAGTEVGRILGDYGADVIKIESNKALDFIRTVIPGPMNAPFASSNRGKDSFGVNLKTEAGRELVRKLVDQADVVVENASAGVMDRLGMGYDDLSKTNPGLVMFSTQLMGADGPWSGWIGYGPNAHAATALQYLWNYPEDVDSPAGSSNIHPDHYVGRLGALAVSAALHRRSRTGKGGYLQTAQFEVLLQLLGDLLAADSLDPGCVQPVGNSHPSAAPWGVYPCAGGDSWCAISVRSDDDWQSLCSVMAASDLATDTTLSRAEDRVRRRDEVDRGVSAWTETHSAVQVTEKLQAAGVPAGVVQSAIDALADTHLQARGFFENVEQRGLGKVTLEGNCFRCDTMPARPASAAPLLGEHTRAICRQRLGLNDAAIEQMLADGVLEEAPTDIE